MSRPVHQDLANNNWFKLSLSNQLANIGSEFYRVYQAKMLHKEKRFESAFLRLIELLNLTLNDKRWQGLRKQEISRLKENILENINYSTANLEAVAGLEKYFYYFGVSRQKKLPDLFGIRD